MIFKYTGFNQSGDSISNNIDAININEAKLKLKSIGIIIIDIEKQETNFKIFSIKKIKNRELSILSKELSMYINSGLTIVESIQIVRNNYLENKSMNLFLNSVMNLLKEGNSFYKSLELQEVVDIPDFFLQSIKISENGGLMSNVLDELSRFLMEEEQFNKEIKNAFTYPLFMLLLSFAMIMFMLIFVVPEITSIFTDMNQELPTITTFVINSADFFKSNYISMITIIVSFIFTLKILIKKNDYFKLIFDKSLLKTPIFGKIIIKSEIARFSYMSSLLHKSGVPFTQIIKLSTDILKNKFIKRIFFNASKNVVEGLLFSKSLKENGFVFDNSFIQALALAEDTSQIENVLENISKLYFQDNKDKISVLLTLLEPILMVFVGGSIGFMVMAMLLPIFSISIS